jgi:hypothetical protein
MVYIRLATNNCACIHSMAHPDSIAFWAAFRAKSEPKIVKRIATKSNVQYFMNLAEAHFVRDLGSSVVIQSREATFACGGRVHFDKDPYVLPLKPNSARPIQPIDIRFGKSGAGVTLHFPGHTSSSTEFQSLLSTCKPAYFGRSDQNVRDETYRKALELTR